jgi:hypothetical protein
MKLFALILCACATVPLAQTGFSVTESLVDPLRWNWASGDGNVTKRVHIHNRRSYTRNCLLICDREPEALVSVPGNDMTMLFVDVPSCYSIGEACDCEEAP